MAYCFSKNNKTLNIGANLVQHLMRQPQKYPTICDYTPTISHDMSMTHDVKHHETPMQKLQEITTAQNTPNPLYQGLSGIFYFVVVCYHKSYRKQI